MKIVGCDLHTRYQQIAMLDEETGALGNVVREVDQNGNTLSDYFYLGSERMGRATPTGMWFYYGDHLGTSRVITDGSNVCYDADYFPWGGEKKVFVNTCPQNYKFTGKERDPDMSVDYFGARMYYFGMGRFYQPDPVAATPLHVIDPQRWNLYSYALNNPLSYTDPDGRDAAAVNFSSMVASLGHEGILSIHSDGSATYARFGPASKDLKGGYGMNEPGHVDVVTPDRLPVVQFGADGLPTQASYDDLQKALAAIEGVDASTVQINYFKTSDADASLLDTWIAQQHQAASTSNRYRFCSSNCAKFTLNGLVAGKAITPAQTAGISVVPNALFFQLAPFASQSKPQPKVPTEQVDHKIIFDPGQMAD